ncbi:MAG TPA: ABC transporter ATP-binding protein [Nocardioidaceae bacterium]|nr:ABC transporter ATP-binding protein [Nocardioidaceae bacterium]
MTDVGEDKTEQAPHPGVVRPESDDVILRVENLTKHFPVDGGSRGRGAVVHAVDGVNFDVKAGETVGLVGESGCGKSTTARCIVRLLKPTSGRIQFLGRDLATVRHREMRKMRQEVQMVFQDPYASLDPRLTVHESIAEPLRVFRRYRRGRGEKRIRELIDLVGLKPEHANRYPHEFSGGQRQRIGIARALALGPRLLVLDEPVSALDVSIQAQVINLLEDLQEELGLSYLFIAHDLAVVRHICDRIAVMHLGHVVEIGERNQIFETPTHPYTQALLSAVPISDPSQRGKRERKVLGGDVPSPTNPPSGCRFRTRCWKAEDVCARKEPTLMDRFGHGHPSACHFADTPKPEHWPVDEADE